MTSITASCSFSEIVDRTLELVLTATVLSSQRRVRLVVNAVGATKLAGWVALSEAQRFSGDRYYS